MAVLKAYTPLDMVNQELWEGEVTVARPHRIKIAETDGDRKLIFFGDFEYAGPAPSGVLKGLDHRDGSTLDFEISKIGADMGSIFGSLNAGNLHAVMQEVFQKADKMIGSSGNETLLGFAGADVLKGKGGADILKGQNGSDKIFGGNGNDKLYGGKGNDVLAGDKGRDVLSGAAGKDKFVFGKSDGRDKITDFQDDIDTIRLNDDLWAGSLTKAQVINRFADVKHGDTVFDFGEDQLVIKDFTDLGELQDDLAIV